MIYLMMIRTIYGCTHPRIHPSVPPSVVANVFPMGNRDGSPARARPRLAASAILFVTQENDAC